MKVINGFLSFFLISVISFVVTFSFLNSYRLVSSREFKLYLVMEFLPEVRVPNSVADAIVRTVDAKINN